jgi:hypothetical protein
MNLVEHLAKLPSWVEYQGCMFILQIGREHVKQSVNGKCISLCYVLDTVDKESPHYETFSQCGSWVTPEESLCNFLLLAERIEAESDLLFEINRFTKYLTSIGISD